MLMILSQFSDLNNVTLLDWIYCHLFNRCNFYLLTFIFKTTTECLSLATGRRIEIWNTFFILRLVWPLGSDIKDVLKGSPYLKQIIINMIVIFFFSLIPALSKINISESKSESYHMKNKLWLWPPWYYGHFNIDYIPLAVIILELHYTTLKKKEPK